MNPLRLSVVIPTCRRPDLVVQCLDRLAPGKQTVPADAYHVVVTDDGKDSPTAAIMAEKYPWAKWVQGPSRGPAANRNNGARHARAAWIAFTDDDCLPDPNWLETILQAFEQGARAVEGAVHPLGDLSPDGMECPANLDGDRFWSANIAVERALFEQLGGFDERFLTAAYEDQDLHVRLKQLVPVVWVPGCIVRHPVRAFGIRKRLAALPVRMHMYARYLAKHRPEELRRGLVSRILACCRNQRSRMKQSLFPPKPKRFLWSVLECTVVPFEIQRAAKKALAEVSSPASGPRPGA